MCTQIFNLLRINCCSPKETSSQKINGAARSLIGRLATRFSTGKTVGRARRGFPYQTDPNKFQIEKKHLIICLNILNLLQNQIQGFLSQ